MKFFSNKPLSMKIPMIITAMAMLGLATSSTFNLVELSRTLNHAEGERLQALMESRKASIENYLESIQEDLSATAKSPYVREALLQYKQAWYTFGGNPEQDLQQFYIHDNPNPVGKRENLDYANDGSDYSAAHKRYHGWFRHFLNLKGYYDIFLFDMDGNLLYTVFKEADFATNLNTGKYKDTDLGNAYRAAAQSDDPEAQHFFDFKPYAPSNGQPASFIAQSVVSESGSKLGVLVFQMPVERINKVMHVSSGLGDTGDTYLVGEDHLLRSDSRLSKESTILKQKKDNEAVDFALEGKSGQTMVEEEDGNRYMVAYGPMELLGTQYAVIAEKSEKEIWEPIYEQIVSVIFGLFFNALFITVMGIFVARTISRPISSMAEAMANLAKENYDVSVPGIERKDEIGRMAASVQVFKENGLEGKNLRERQVENERRAEEDKKRMMNELANSFDAKVGGAIKSLSMAAEKLQGAAKGMENTARETENASSSVASASEQTSANAATVASATEEMTASAREISKQISDVATKANMAANSANSTSRKVDELNKLVANIGEVVVAIKDIAEQTNLLALNATIEAARAGEAGKGFAVVADEVKKLASETAKKTEEIETRITEIQQATQDSVEAMQHIIRNIADIDSASTGTAGAVEEQNSVIAEISRNISEVSDAARQVASIIANVQSAANDTGQASQMLNVSAGEIADLSSNLEASVRDFLSQIRDDRGGSGIKVAQAAE